MNFTCRGSVNAAVNPLVTIQMRQGIRFSLRTLLMTVLFFALVVFVCSPTTVQIPVSSSLLMNSIYYSEGARINVYDENTKRIAANCLISVRCVEIESQAIDPSEINDLLTHKFPPIIDNSYLEIQVNWLQKYRIYNSKDVRVGGIRQRKR